MAQSADKGSWSSQWSLPLEEAVQVLLMESMTVDRILSSLWPGDNQI